MNVRGAACPAGTGCNSVHAHRQDGLVRDACLDRMERSVSGRGVAQYQFRKEMPGKPSILFWWTQSCDTLVRLKPLIRFHSMKPSALEKNGTIQISGGI